MTGVRLGPALVAWPSPYFMLSLRVCLPLGVVPLEGDVRQRAKAEWRGTGCTRQSPVVLRLYCHNLI